MDSENKQSVGLVTTRKIRLIDEDKPLKLQCGESLAPIDAAYETYGELNKAGDNTVLICHALSGNAHVAGKHSESDRKSGWWDSMVGPGKGIDTNKYFVICSNCLGGCSGTTGPSSINPKTGKKYGLDFPIITMADMVKVQKLLLDKLGIKQLLAVIGGSMGGMQVLQWAIDYPDFVKGVIPIATSTHPGPQAIAFDAVGRNAILSDARFNNGQYTPDKSPDRGLGIARMIGHITYLSEKGMQSKFGRRLRDANNYSYDFNSEFAVETYLDYQGRRFVERFDANSYLYITKAIDYFDLQKDYGSLQKAFEKCRSRFLAASFSSDWLFTKEQSERIVEALISQGKDVSYCNIESPYGHDSFLLETDTLAGFISAFLETTHRPQTRAENYTSAYPKNANRFEMAKRARVDYELIESLIPKSSKVLDVGCADGELLARLTADKGIQAEGIERDQDLLLQCIEKGVSVIQRDIERGLAAYADKTFDVVILSKTLQTLIEPKEVFIELLRVGKKVIVSFPNFAHYSCRFQLALQGKAPVSKQLPFTWYNSPNIHFFSLKDFDDFCEKLGINIEKKIPLSRGKWKILEKIAPNLFSEQVIYVTSKK
jgi:homoserine O-acetyltransferase